MDRYPASKGISLIELIVVVAIVSVLLMVAYPRYHACCDRAVTTAQLSNIQQLRNVINRYYEDKGRYPDSLQRLVDGRYLRALPVDPVTGRSDTWILVTANAEQGSGIVDVRSGAPGSNAGGVPYRDLEP